MQSRKRTHTTISEKAPGQNHKKTTQARRVIAAEAARIMATQAQPNYRIAKMKAAERLGVDMRTVLPSNAEVEEALRAYQGFYGGQQHVLRLKTMRSAALSVMRKLERFSPRLAGPVIEGTADEHSRATIHVFSDPPDAIVIHLLDNGIAFHHEQRKIRWHDGRYHQVPILVFEVDDVEVELMLFEGIDLRQAPLSPVDGRPQKRASLSEVECMLDQA